MTVPQLELGVCFRLTTEGDVTDIDTDTGLPVVVRLVTVQLLPLSNSEPGLPRTLKKLELYFGIGPGVSVSCG